MPFEFPMRGETKLLDPEEREKLPGSFIALPDGGTHYEIIGPRDGPMVVLVHGFSVPYFIWEPTFQFLAESGYRVLRFDLFGRGFSDRPFVRYDLELFTRQLKDLLDVLSIDACRGVCGLSMGGIIAAEFVNRYPERVERLALIDPAGFPMDTPGIFNALMVPGLGELIFGSIGFGLLESSIAGDFYDPEHIKTFVEQYKVPMQYKGFKRAILSTIRAGLLKDGVAVYKRLGQESETPVLLVWGEEDQTVPYKFSRTFLSLVPRATFLPVAESGHIPHYEHADQVNPTLLEFLSHE
jgi:pimeloyl-ACP methyl ester carboxylesterase